MLKPWELAFPSYTSLALMVSSFPCLQLRLSPNLLQARQQLGGGSKTATVGGVWPLLDLLPMELLRKRPLSLKIRQAVGSWTGICGLVRAAYSKALQAVLPQLCTAAARRSW
jgi:hypothetical protein